MRRVLALVAILPLGACGRTPPVAEATRPIIRQVTVEPAPVPKRLRTCSDEPEILSEDAPQSELAPAYVEALAAGQDCRAKLKAVDGILTRAKR